MVAAIHELTRSISKLRQRRHPRLERGRIDDWFEHRTGLAPGVARAIQLRLFIVAAADHRQHIPGKRVHGDQCDLGRHAARLVDAIERLQLMLHCFIGHPLEIEVERCHLRARCFAGIVGRCLRH